MSGWWLLAARRLAHRPVATVLITMCIAVAVALPIGARMLLESYETALRARAAATPYVIGAPGDRFDLVLAALYFRTADVESIDYGLTEELRDGGSLPVPLVLGASAQGHPLVGTEPAYYRERGLRVIDGELPLLVGEVALGSSVATALGAEPGTKIWSDQQALYDIVQTHALELRVVGVLAESGSADDGAIFTDVRTTWALTGLVHGHDDPAAMAGSRQVGEDLVLVEAGAPTEAALDEARDVHVHGDPATFPITSILWFPDSPRTGSITTARLNAAGVARALAPGAVVEDLIASVLRVRRLIDGLSVLLAVVTTALIGLVIAVNVRSQQAEREMLHRIGCPRSVVLRLVGAELALIAIGAVILAGLAITAGSALAPNLTEVLRGS